MGAFVSISKRTIECIVARGVFYVPSKFDLLAIFGIHVSQFMFFMLWLFSLVRQRILMIVVFVFVIDMQYRSCPVWVDVKSFCLFLLLPFALAAFS